MNNKFPHKQSSELTINEEDNKIPKEMLSSTQVLSKYCKQNEKVLLVNETPIK